MEGSEQGRDPRNEIQAGENGKKVHWGSARVATASRVLRSVANRAGSTGSEKR